MAGRYVELPNTVVKLIEDNRGIVTVEFSTTHIIKSEGIPGVNESTRTQNGATIVFEEAEIEGDLPKMPFTISTGDITVHGTTYRDMIALPLENVGYTELELTGSDGQKVLITSQERATLTLPGPGNYIEHVPETLGK